ncbi:hypothetical protein GCM10023310_12360 [Paenibacillus vulneris]|uniref:Heparin lyase I family protein n=1 Tax=Paenibacillus vulneris TaxID=1133364 RepID=A0ABW3UIV8_9BACL|nr:MULTISPECIES: heparin lyase I family protein [unclassified Paenibacillus]MBE1441452.1 hypothetical protein [Paenibacillus sp. OAS669]
MKKKVKTMVAGALLVSAMVLQTAVAWAATTTTIDSDGPNTGQDAYQIFKSKLGSDPIDGPGDASHIWETTSSPVGNVFQFKLNSTGDYDGSNTDRQRNELKAYNSSPSAVKGTNGTTMTYKWKFKVLNGFQMPPSGNFCHIFQLKASGGDDGAPILTFSVEKNKLTFRHSPIGADMSQVTTLASTDWSNVLNTWVEATVTVKNSDNGTVSMTLKKLDGTTLMSYSGSKDMWRDGADFNRPKWGIYRKIFSGMTEANIQFANFSITKQ